MTYIEELWELTGERPLLLPGTALIARDREGRILLQRRGDDGTWGLPGGYLEIGETLEDGARREAREEMGLELDELRFFAVFAGPEHYHEYPRHGRVYAVSIVYLAENVTGPLKADQSETREIRFFPPAELPDDLERNTREILGSYLEDPASGP